MMKEKLMVTRPYLMKGLMLGALIALSASCEDATINGGGGIGGGGESSGPGLTAEQSDAVYAELFGAETLDEMNTAPTIFDNPSPAKPIVATWAKVLTPADMNAIQAVESDRVVFGPGASEAVANLELMEIINSTDEDNLFLRRVLRVERLADGSTIVHTRDAAVTEAVIHGPIDMAQTTPTAGPQGAAGNLITNSQNLEVRGKVKKHKFNVQIEQDRFQINGEFPFGDATLIPEFEARVTQQPRVEGGFNAEIELAGTRNMCEILMRTDEPLELREGLPLFGEYYEWPPELRKLVWAVHWGGNVRTGNATLNPTSHASRQHTNFNGELRTRTNARNSQWSTRPSSTVQMRPEFVAALEEFEARVQQSPELSEHFITGGEYIRVPDGSSDSRAEILGYYRNELRPTLAGPAQETLDHYLNILEAQGDDLQWLATSLAVAREHCQGRARNANAAVVVKTAVSVRGSLELKSDSNTLEGTSAEQNLYDRGFFMGSGGYRKRLVSQNLRTFWIFPGGFPVAITPNFSLYGVVKKPEISGSYKMDYGPYELIVEGGFTRGSQATSGDGAMNEGGCSDDTEAGLCGKITRNFSAGDMTITAREANFTGEVGVSIVPEFMLKFYGVAGVGGAVPIYAGAKATAVGRVEANTDHGANAAASICVGAKAGIKVDLVGRLENPFAAADSNNAVGELATTLLDSCSSNIPIFENLCLKASAGVRGRAGGDGVNYGQFLWNTGSDTCPASKLTVEVVWEEQQDVDLFLTEPGGGSLDRNTNSSVGGERDVSKGCTILPGDTSRCTLDGASEFVETATYGDQLGIVIPGTYTVRAVNATGTRPVSATIKIKYVDERGQERINREESISLDASRNASSSEISFTIPED